LRAGWDTAGSRCCRREHKCLSIGGAYENVAVAITLRWGFAAEMQRPCKRLQLGRWWPFPFSGEKTIFLFAARCIRVPIRPVPSGVRIMPSASVTTPGSRPSSRPRHDCDPGGVLGEPLPNFWPPRISPQDTVRNVSRVSPSPADALLPRTPFQAFHPPRMAA
jgi:hypothetical protein